MLGWFGVVEVDCSNNRGEAMPTAKITVPNWVVILALLIAVRLETFWLTVSVATNLLPPTRVIRRIKSVHIF